MAINLTKFNFQEDLTSQTFNQKLTEIQTHLNNLSSEAETLRTENQELRQLLNNKVDLNMAIKEKHTIAFKSPFTPWNNGISEIFLFNNNLKFISLTADMKGSNLQEWSKSLVQTIPEKFRPTLNIMLIGESSVDRTCILTFNNQGNITRSNYSHLTGATWAIFTAFYI